MATDEIPWLLWREHSRPSYSAFREVSVATEATGSFEKKKFEKKKENLMALLIKIALKNSKQLLMTFTLCKISQIMAILKLFSSSFLVR